MALFAKADYVRAIWATLAGLGIVATVYQVWSKERRKVIDLEEQLVKEQEHNRPKFSAHIDFLVPDKMPDAYPVGGTSVLVGASIVNTGAPSIAGVWRLIVHLSNSAPLVLEPEVLPPSITLAPSLGRSSTVISSADALYEKVSHDPIATGARVSGALWFLAPNVAVQKMRESGVRYVLAFQDSHERPWETDFVLPGSTTPDVKYFPGITSIPKPKQEPS